jgi:cell division protease FtsH
MMEKRDRDRRPVDDEEQEGADENQSLFPGNPMLWLMLFLFVVGGIMLLRNWTGGATSGLPVDFFLAQLEQGNIQKLEQVDTLQLRGQFRESPDAPRFFDATGQKQQELTAKGERKQLDRNFTVTLPPTMSEEFKQRMERAINEHNVQYSVQPVVDNSTFYMFLMMLLLPLGMIAFLWLMFKRTRDQLMGGGFLSGFTRSPAKRYESSQQPITFDDVAGLEGVKADLQEIVDFLKSPDKFRKLGGQVPKGVLLNGPPGTGKTLLARAIAGEAGVPFYSVNGSEFIQMFVGVGASRVRDLFAEAKEHSPAIIFIDEVDAVGRQRGAGLGGGHDEREQTLNQILSEMDGFEPTQSVIIVAATNRPDVLDPALLRPGRFDRHITVDRPTMKGREEIFKVHVRDVPLAADVDLKRLAAGTVGLTGADIRNIVNEAALWAARKDHDAVHMADFEYARDKVLMGPKREEILRADEKLKTAYHEAGHTLVAWLLPDANRVHKVTVIPRGRALGVTQILPSEDRLSMSEQEIYAHLDVMLAGRAAEKLIFKQNSIGAQNDLERATSVARRMVTQWGMSEKVGPVNYKISDEDPFLGREIHHGREFSEYTLQMIDGEVSRILHEAADRAYNLLEANRDKVEALATALASREELDENEIAAIVGPSAHHLKGDNSEPGSVMAPTPTQIAHSSGK